MSFSAEAYEDVSDIKVDYIHKDDVPAILAIEREQYEAHKYEDPDFGELYPAFVLNEKSLMEVVERYKSKANNVNDTRVIVAKTGREVLGCLAYEPGEDCYRIIAFTGKDDRAKVRLLESLLKKCLNSEKRKRVEITVQDGDWVKLKFFMNNSLTGDTKDKNRNTFKVFRAAKAAEDGQDLWELEYTLPKIEKQKGRP